MRQLAGTAALAVGRLIVRRIRALIVGVDHAVEVAVVLRRGAAVLAVGTGGLVRALIHVIRDQVAIGIGQRAAIGIHRRTGAGGCALIQMPRHAVTVSIAAVAAQVVTGGVGAAVFVGHAAGRHEHIGGLRVGQHIGTESTIAIDHRIAATQRTAIRGFHLEAHAAHITGIQPGAKAAAEAVDLIRFAVVLEHVAFVARPRHRGLTTGQHAGPGVRVIHRADDLGAQIGAQ